MSGGGSLKNNRKVYTFKQIVTPQLNLPITIPEDEEPLELTSLMPNAILVIVRFQVFVAAYDSNLMTVYGLLMGGCDLAIRPLKNFYHTVDETRVGPSRMGKALAQNVVVQTIYAEGQRADS